MYIFVFAWDIRKTITNYEKHGVPFEEAVEEHRFKRIGQSITGRILFVVYTTRRTDDEKETIDIINARQASRKKREAYSRLAD